jgi:hypothetical protein
MDSAWREAEGFPLFLHFPYSIQTFLEKMFFKPENFDIAELARSQFSRSQVFRK